MNHEPVRASPPSKASPAATARLTSQSLLRLGRATVLTVVVLAVAAGLLLLVVPGTLLARESSRLAAAVIFATSLVALAIGRVPGLAIDRAGVAVVGAALMVACGALPLDDAYKAVDLNTLTLLLGMMIVVANLRLSGFFAVAGGWIMRRAGRPLTLLIAITVLAGVFSAFLVNDAVCLVLAPLVIELTLTLRRNPVPYLLAVAMASNIGSTATIPGNPQNMMIGSLSGISYVSFAAALAPVAVFGLRAARRPRRAAGDPSDRATPPPRICRCHSAGGTAGTDTVPSGADVARGGRHDPSHRPVFRGPAAGKGGDYRWRADAVDPPRQERTGLRPDRLVVAADGRRPVHHRRRCRT